MRGRAATRTFTLPLMLLPLVHAECRGATGPSPDRIAIIRAEYRRIPSDILEIKEPIKVEMADIYHDGGSMLIEIVDTRGRRLTACLDGRMRILSDANGLFSQARVDSIEAALPHLYLNARYVTDSTAVEVPVRGAEEAALYGLLLRWSAKQPRERLERPVDGHWTREQRAAGLLQILDRRFAEPPTLRPLAIDRR